MYSVTRRSVSFMTSMAMPHLRKALVRAQMVTQVAIPVEQAVLAAASVAWAAAPAMAAAADAAVDANNITA